MTEESIGEQASAGLDRLTSDERVRFTALNEAYKARFGIPFIMAVAGASKDAILAAFETRLKSTPEAEFETALGQVEKISLLRLKEIMRLSARPSLLGRGEGADPRNPRQRDARVEPEHDAAMTATARSPDARHRRRPPPRS